MHLILFTNSNKITCPCGTRICYVCRAKIRDYSHFCQTAHCDHKSCGKCVLFSNSIEEDRVAVKKAGLKAANEITSNGISLEKVKMGKLIEKSPSKKNEGKRKTRQVPPQPAVHKLNYHTHRQ